MSRPLLLVPLLVFAVSSLACGDDATDPGVRDQCADSSGVIIGCTPRAVETPMDACWKLVDCGALPQSSDNYDWADCVRDIERMIEERQSLVLACVDASTCDDLKADLCLELGQQ